MKIGIYGGAFNPIHYGHMNVANTVYKKMNLDKLIFLPAGNPVHRKIDGSTGQDRSNMIELAIKDKENYFVSPVEINSKDSTPTVVTLRKYAKWWRGNDLYFIIGSDQADEFHKWQEPDELLSLATFVVAVRNAGAYDGMIHDRRGMKEIDVDEINISGTKIRDAIKSGFPITGMVTKSVEKYIGMRGLYK